MLLSKHCSTGSLGALSCLTEHADSNGWPMSHIAACNFSTLLKYRGIEAVKPTSYWPTASLLPQQN